ncbi:DUF2993 domain-containing protein [Jatrophihabitans endophyticus]|uniref:LmeA family phospholipid-binding protein n=1 Tax=Jatrophihabitans endophyticus TaxID=1206085 RepID=UPI001A01A3A9|nr:DUF2993 domain-containing protein [Jatrophihabitans endophyticus]MBE7187405.1 DUF2993 domain-containing protein [Jatrophihabitans endophyticus]
MRKLIVFVVVVAVLLVVVDRVGDFVAERIVADNLQSSQHLQQRPDVTIDGVPFVTQFVSGHYQHVEIDASDVRVGSTPLALSTLHTDFRTVSVSHNFQTFSARTASATATVDFAGLSRLLKVHVHYGGHGRIALSKKLPVIGRKTVTFAARYANGVLRFGGAAVNGLGHLGHEVASALSHYLDIRTPLRTFPFHIRVRSIRVDSSGLQLTLTGRNLHYRNG